MKFKTIEVDNFLSIGNMKMGLENRGLLLVVGENNDDPSAESNGAGKSSFIEAMYWCLYGKTLRGIKYVDSIVNRVSKKDCRVRLDMEVSNGSLVIERYRKHKDYKNDIRAFLNGVDISSSDPRITQNMIDRELGMNSDTFARLVFIGQGFTFRYTDMSDKELKEFIEGLIGAQTFAIAHESAKTNLTSMKAKLVGVESSIGSYNTQLERLNRQLEDAKNKSILQKQEIEREIERVSSNITAINNEILGLRADLAKLCKDLDTEIGVKVKESEELDAKYKLLKVGESQIEYGYGVRKLDICNTYGDPVDEAEEQKKVALADVDSKISSMNNAKIALIQEHSASMSKLQDKLREANANYSIIRNKFNDEARAISKQLQDVSNSRELYNLNIELSSLKAKEEALQQEIQRSKVSVGSKCPTCGQIVDEKTLTTHLNESKGFENREKELSNSIGLCKSKIEGLENVNNSLKQRFTEDIEAKNRQIEETEKSHDHEISVFEGWIKESKSKPVEGMDALDASIRDLLSMKADTERQHDITIDSLNNALETALDGLDSEFNAKRKESKAETEAIHELLLKTLKDVESIRGRKSKEVSVKEGVIHSKEKEVQENTFKIDKLKATDVNSNVNLIESQIKDCYAIILKEQESEKECKVQIYVLDYIVDAFGLGGIRSFILDSVLTYLNERIKVYSQELFDGNTQIYLSPVKTQKNKSLVEKITIEVTTDGGSYDASSGGERRKVDVALFLAFRDLNKSTSPIGTNVEAYDEILSYLDGESASRVVQLLIRDESVPTKILITHRNDISVIGRHQIIKAVKTNGITTYIEN